MQFLLLLLTLVSWSRGIGSMSICEPGSFVERPSFGPDPVSSGATLIVNCTQPTGPTIVVQVEPSLQTIIRWDNTTEEKVSFGYICAGNVSLNFTTLLPTREPWKSHPVQRQSPQLLNFGDECTFYGCYQYEYEQRFVLVNGTRKRTPVVGVALDSTTCVIDSDECSDGTALCEHICTDTIGGYVCTCMEGYQLDKDGHSCIDIDECTTGLHNCDHTCAKNTDGGYICTCDDGYVLNEDEHTCDDIDECELNETLCEHNCSNVIGSYECTCLLGYQLAADGHSCVDIDECTTGLHNCDHTCAKNTDGGYICACDDGYVLNEDEHTCDDIDECELNETLCEHNCSNVIGSYECTCLLGYQLAADGHSCVDIDECTTGLHNCDHTCAQNTDGGYICACDDGYVLNEDEHTCDDVDECELNETLCEYNCSNVIGSYECTCLVGYQLAADGHSCVDMNECLDGKALCQQICHNSVGSYNCSCQEGYRMDGKYNCTDIDECEEKLVNCGDHATCINTNGSNSCVCDDDYERNGSSCTLRIIHLLKWILPVILTIFLVPVLICAIVLWRKHKRDKYNNDKQFKSLFKNQFKKEEVDPTYSPVSLLPAKMLSYSFPLSSTLEICTPSAYSSVQELEFDTTVKCSTIQQVDYSNCYSQEIQGAAGGTIHEGSELNDNQSAFELEDRGNCRSVTLKKNILSTSTDQLEVKSVQRNSDTFTSTTKGQDTASLMKMALADALAHVTQHENATRQQTNEGNILLTLSDPAVRHPPSGYVADCTPHAVPSPVQDQCKMTNFVSENHQSIPYTLTSQPLSSAVHKSFNRNSQCLDYDPQPTAFLSESLYDSGIPMSMSGSHFHLPLPSYNTTDSSSNLSDHASSGYSSPTGFTIASSVTSETHTCDHRVLHSNSRDTTDLSHRVCYFTEMDDDAQMSTTESLFPATSSNIDSGIPTSLDRNLSNVNNSIYKSALNYTTSTVEVHPKPGFPAPSSQPENYSNAFTPNEAREQEILPG